MMKSLLCGCEVLPHFSVSSTLPFQRSLMVRIPYCDASGAFHRFTAGMPR
jgi:hypothetical protein